MALALHPRISLPPNPVIGYTRKSTEEDTRQVASHERQVDQIERFCATHGWSVFRWFRDSQSGKSFDRPDFQELIRFCEENPQPKIAPGRVICLDYDRFGRPLNAQKKVDLLEFQRWIIRLADVGWELDFALTPKSGNTMLDGLTGSLKAIMSAEYLEKLSANARDGKKKAAIKGLWNGGPAPFPTARYDLLSGRTLCKGERANNGASVLGPDTEHPEHRQYWEEGAKHILSGGTLDSVATMFDRWKVPQYYHNVETGRGLNWRHANIYKLYTNVALVGKIEFEYTNDDGTTDTHFGDAQWGPLVDEELFWAVREEVMRRREQVKRAKPSREYFLEPECYECGSVYTAATFNVKAKGHEGERRRAYTHPVPNTRMNDVQAARVRQAGCKHWYLPAEAVENAVRDLIIEQRSSKEFREALANLLDEQDMLQHETALLEKAEETKLSEFEGQKERLKKALRFAESDAEMEEVMGEIRSLQRDIETQIVVLEQARTRTQQARAMSKDLMALVDESSVILGAWNQEGTEGLIARRRLVDLWVEHVWVQMLEVPGKPRSATKRLHIVLRTMPDCAITRDLKPNFENRWKRFKGHTADEVGDTPVVTVDHTDGARPSELASSLGSINTRFLLEFSPNNRWRQGEIRKLSVG